MGDGEEEDAVAEERGEGANGEDEPRREPVAGETGDQADVLADIVGDTEECDLSLVESQHRLQRV